MLDIAIVGAGPYGLSVASHLKRRGVAFRIFGRPMDSWLAHMPKGMLLKSDGFASNISDPDGDFTLKHFCAERGIKYGEMGVPVRLETFTAYGLAFKERKLPELENTLVLGLKRVPGGFILQLDTGETVKARRVVLAVGITHFEYTPPGLTHLPAELLSHSFRHHDLEPFKSRRVLVIGGGASATDLAGLLAENGVDVHLISRKMALNFHEKADISKSRSFWQGIRNPQSGLGPGLRSRLYADAPSVFHHLPERLRLDIVRTFLGPSGGWFTKDKVIGRVPLMLGFSPERAEIHGGQVLLKLSGANTTKREILTDHVIAATGYKVNLGRLTFLSEEIRSNLKAVDDAPVLSSSFESSLPGLYFVGIAAANSFGPVMRFAFGAGFAARHLTKAIAKVLSRDRATMPVTNGFAKQIGNDNAAAQENSAIKTSSIEMEKVREVNAVD
jgi:thioredoxin reductase